MLSLSDVTQRSQLGDVSVPSLGFKVIGASKGCDDVIAVSDAINSKEEKKFMAEGGSAGSRTLVAESFRADFPLPAQVEAGGHERHAHESWRELFFGVTLAD